MDSTLPADLLELKARIDEWRANKKYNREPIPAELRQAAMNMSRRYSPALVRRILKLDPWRLNGSRKTPPPPTAVRKKPQNAFFKLPLTADLPETVMPAPQSANPCRIQLERGDGSRLTLTMPSIDSATLNSLCCDFLRS